MARYLLLGKYTPEGLAKVRADGFRTRPESNKTVFDRVGGSLLCMYFMTPGAGAWDFCAICECSSDDLFALSTLTGPSGMFEKSEYHEIRTGEEADAAAAGAISWTAPGQGRG